MLNTLTLVLIIVGCSAMRVWLEVRLCVCTWVLAWELVRDMRVKRTTHCGLVEAYGGWAVSRRVLIDAE